MAVTIYRSTDGSAPTVSGTVNDLVNLLDKCLVVGYGTQSAAGWTKPYTSTNAAIFTQGSGSNGYSFQVDDNGPGAGTAKEGRIRGYESMTAYGSGTNPFPTVAQATNGFFIRKSVTADATTRPWIVVADSRTCYGFIQTGDTAGKYYAFAMGEYYSYKSSDAGRTILIARSTENSATISVDNLDLHTATIGTSTSNGAGKSLARSYTQAVGAISVASVALCGDSMGLTSGNIIGLGAINYTNAPNNKTIIQPIRVVENSAASAGDVRGTLRGLWCWCHPVAACSDGDTFSGTGALAGRTFMVIKLSCNGGVYIIETSNTWDSN